MNFENVVFPDSGGFQCKKCGACCRVQPPEASLSEQKQIKEKGFADFLDSPDERGIRWIRRKKDGSCFFLGKDNQCVIYNVRPAICRLEPFTIVDYDYEKNRIELELNFPSACGCEGVSDDKVLPIAVIGKAAQAMLQKILELTAKDLGLSVIDKRVASEARSRIMRSRMELADLSI